MSQLETLRSLRLPAVLRSVRCAVVERDPGGHIPSMTPGAERDVVSRTIEDHGGRVGHEIGEPGGAVFYFEIPRVQFDLADETETR